MIKDLIKYFIGLFGLIFSDNVLIHYYFIFRIKQRIIKTRNVTKTAVYNFEENFNIFK